MIPRAEVGLIVAAIGLQLKLISDASYAVVVMMAMVTTVVTPPLLKLQFRSGEPRKRAAKSTLQVFLGSLNPMLGLVVCTALAIVLSLLLRKTTLRGFVPYGFLVVIVATAKVWGRLAGVLGTAAAALAFSFLLYSPVGSWIVNDDIARANLGWMVLTGMMSSHFFGKSSASQDMMRSS